jgi:hypothetical protein
MILLDRRRIGVLGSLINKLEYKTVNQGMSNYLTLLSGGYFGTNRQQPT